METHENIAVFRHLVEELVNRGNVAIVDDLMTPDFVEHEELPPGFSPDAEGVKAFFSLLHTAFPDLQADIEETVAQDDKVVFRMTWHGTQTGPFLGMPSSGQRVTFEVFDMARVAGGKIAEHWGLANNLKLLQQLGAVPAPGGDQH